MVGMFMSLNMITKMVGMFMSLNMITKKLTS